MQWAEWSWLAWINGWDNELGVCTIAADTNHHDHCNGPCQQQRQEQRQGGDDGGGGDYGQQTYHLCFSSLPCKWSLILILKLGYMDFYIWPGCIRLRKLCWTTLVNVQGFCSDRSSLLCATMDPKPDSYHSCWHANMNRFSFWEMNADYCRLMLIYADWCWLMLIDADWWSNKVQLGFFSPVIFFFNVSCLM